MNLFDFSQRTVLVVEDSDFVRHVLKKHLADMGFARVLDAANGAEAVEQLAHSPDVIVCDIEMSPLNGFEFLKILRARPAPQNKTPVIYLTCAAESAAVALAMKLGVDAYLLKPVQPEDLRQKIATLLYRKNP